MSRLGRRFDVGVSVFKTSKSVSPVQTTLKEVLLSTMEGHQVWHNTIEIVRQFAEVKNKKVVSGLKMKLPCVIVGASVNSRKADLELEEKLMSVNGFVQVDFDAQDNQGVTPQEMREVLSKSPYIAYAGLSASGMGVWGLIQVSDPTELKSHALAIKEESWGLVIDTSKSNNLMEVRYLSVDREPYINNDFQVYDKQVIVVEPTIAKRSIVVDEDDEELLGRLMSRLDADRPRGKGYHLRRYAVGISIGQYIGAGYFSKETVLDRFNEHYSVHYPQDDDATRRQEQISFSNGLEKGIAQGGVKRKEMKVDTAIPNAVDHSKYYQLKEEEHEHDQGTRRTPAESLEEEIARTERSIRASEQEIKRIEGLFAQATKDLPIEWFRPSYARGFQGEDRLSVIRYWCS